MSGPLAAGTPSRILVIEDDPQIARFIELELRAEGYAVEVARTGPAGLGAARDHPPALVVLDLLLPEMDGLEICRRLRATGQEVPIIAVTARDAVPDRVAGLEAGADDYLVKPFAIEELIARLRALTRRTAEGHPGALRSYADLTLAVDGRRAVRSGRTIELTGREAALLELL